MCADLKVDPPPQPLAYSAWIGLGSNLFDRCMLLRSAIGELAALGQIVQVSSVWETEPVGIEDQPCFLNAALLLRTGMSPHELLHELLRIEMEHGRDRSQRLHKGPRTLDLDLLLMACDGEPIVQHSPILTLPHPSMHERRFVLAPLAEIAPELQHPRMHRSMAELLEMLEQEGANRPDAVRRVGPLEDAVHSQFRD
jgi:2-amino-4-hydroxy-6-hydroxymethyldihydropteridine diphosphokinase